MPQKSGFFDTTADDPREYPARDFARYFSRFIGNGVYHGGTQLKVTATGKDSNVSVNIGDGFIDGYLYSVYDTPLVLPVQPATTQDRIDRVVLRLDTSTPVRSIKAVVLQGNPSASPNPPTLVRSGDIYDLSLAQVLLKANTSTIQPHQITDERLNTQLCGIVMGIPDRVDTTSIFNEFQSWLKTKTTEYQKQWSDFIQGVQTSGFATPDFVRTTISSEMKQKHQLCDGDGTTIDISNTDLNELMKTGFYSGNNLKNAPTAFGASWMYVEVVGWNSIGVLQKVYHADEDVPCYVRRKSSGTWQPWIAYVTATEFEALKKSTTAELAAVKQRGIDLRASLAGVVNAKKVPASASDTFEQLIGKVGAIKTDMKIAKGDNSGRSIYKSLYFEPKAVVISYSGGFNYNDSEGFGSKSIHVSGSSCFVAPENAYGSITASGSSGRDGSSEITINCYIRWSSHGFSAEVTPYGGAYRDSAYASIGYWYAFGV